MQASGSRGSGPEQLERELRHSLYRFDCPDAHTLGEYQLDVLDQVRRTRIATHTLDCDECRAELQTLRTFLAAPISLPDTVVARARRIVATLFAPPKGDPSYAALRGASDVSTRVYEAGDVTLTLGPGQTSGSLFGLVVAAGLDPTSLAGRAVSLLARGGVPITTTLDDLGNFEFTGITPGRYAIEIDLPDGVVVVEELQVD